MKTLISTDNLPIKYIPNVVLYFTALSYWNAPIWLWIVFSLVLIVSFIYEIVSPKATVIVTAFEKQTKK